MTTVVTVSGWIWKRNGRSLHHIGSLREPLQSVGCSYHEEMFLERKEKCCSIQLTVILHSTVQACVSVPSIGVEQPYSAAVWSETSTLLAGVWLSPQAYSTTCVWCTQKHSDVHCHTKEIHNCQAHNCDKDVIFGNAKYAFVPDPFFDWQALAQIKPGSLYLRYLLAGMRSSDINSLASIVTFSKLSLSNSHWPRRMLFMVSASLSPKKGDRPLRLESNQTL